jgi:multicomponent Na+:H+ antiporter subunit E
MVIARTTTGSAPQLAAAGLLSSLVVDNQLVDVAAADHEMQYHAVRVPGTTPDAVRERVNGPIEDRLPPRRPAHHEP